jgi:predicted amidophosphoribosyltransferase
LIAGETHIKEYPAWSAYRYDGAVKQIVRRYKYSGQKWLGRFMGDAIFGMVSAGAPPGAGNAVSDAGNTISDAGNAVSDGQSTQRKEKNSKANTAGGCTPCPGGMAMAVTCVCHVPLHKKRRAGRGFDQAEVLARRVAHQLNVPHIPALRRIRNTKTQTKLSEPQRRENIRGAFVLAAGVSGNVLLIDDVLTTGATSAECARVLKEAGAENVLIATFARSVYAGANMS